MSKMKNPCIDVCQFDENQICVGCRRTKIEAKSWWRYNDEQKLEVLENIKTRKPQNIDYYEHYV
ncbi:MAG: hypothetical protein B6D64_03105 [Bacteroidetes bacterium 4484_276]|nr:MAG: hypothetical protein B6D64_03105 [Bacteroidetes bacterium 4484_276]